MHVDQPAPLRVGQGPVPEPSSAIWTPTYLLLSSSMFLAYAHQALLIPAVPLYVVALGGSGAIAGLVLAAFSAPSVVVRPLVGYWSDRWNAVVMLALGGVVLGVTGLAHLVPVIGVLAIVSAVRGIAWAGVNTGGSTVLAHIAPASRRGEAASYFDAILSLPHAFFPALAVGLIALPTAGFGPVFILSGLLGFLSAVVALPVARWRPAGPAPRSPQPSRQLGAFALYDRRVLLAALLLAFVTLTHPAAQAFLPLYAAERGVENVGWYYFAHAVVGIVVRVFAGRLSDRIGRGLALMIGFCCAMLGLFLILIMSNLPVLILAGVVYSIGHAICAPTTFALAIERADPRQRGAAMGTYTAAYPLGNALGAAVSGIAIELGGYSAMYVATIAMTGLGLLTTAANWGALRRPEGPKVRVEA